MLSDTQALQTLLNIQAEAEEATIELGDRLIAVYYKDEKGIEFGKQYELPEKLEVPAMGAINIDVKAALAAIKQKFPKSRKLTALERKEGALVVTVGKTKLEIPNRGQHSTPLALSAKAIAEIDVPIAKWQDIVAASMVASANENEAMRTIRIAQRNGLAAIEALSPHVVFRTTFFAEGGDKGQDFHCFIPANVIQALEGMTMKPPTGSPVIITIFTQWVKVEYGKNSALAPIPAKAWKFPLEILPQENLTHTHGFEIIAKELEKALGKTAKGANDDFRVKADKQKMFISAETGRSKPTEIDLNGRVRSTMEILLHSSSLVQAILKIASIEKVAVLLPIAAPTLALHWATTTLLISGALVQGIKAAKALEAMKVDEEPQPDKPGLKVLPGGKGTEVAVDIEGKRVEPPKDAKEAKKIAAEAKESAQKLKTKAEEVKKKDPTKAAELEAKADQLEDQAKKLESFKGDDFLGAVIELFWTNNRIIRLAFYKYPVWDFKIDVVEQEFDETKILNG